MMKAQGRENSQAQASAPNLNAPTKNRFYALHSKGEKDESTKRYNGEEEGRRTK